METIRLYNLRLGHVALDARPRLRHALARSQELGSRGDARKQVQIALRGVPGGAGNGPGQAQEHARRGWGPSSEHTIWATCFLLSLGFMVVWPSSCALTRSQRKQGPQAPPGMLGRTHDLQKSRWGLRGPAVSGWGAGHLVTLGCRPVHDVPSRGRFSCGFASRLLQLLKAKQRVKRGVLQVPCHPVSRGRP